MPPDVSVVVPTHDRPAGLAALLGALEVQVLAPPRFEVVVVDDGSATPVRTDPGALALRVLRHERPRGPAAARNTGWRAARAPLVAFVDDDCAPVPGWLAALVEEAGDGGDALVIQGPVAPAPAQRAELTPLSHTIEVGGPSRLFVSANIAYSRTLLERTRGFDESFRHACGEDVELGARALAAGADTRFAPGAVVHHEVRQPSLGALLRQTWKWTDSVRALSMHPELRDLLVARVFWKKTHPPLLLAAGAIAGRRPLVAAVAAAPYLLHYRRRYRGSLRALARALPVHLVVDAAEVVTAAAGSVRWRTLML